MVLMASLSCRISPRTSTVIFLERSPLATAIVTSAMLRTCAGEVGGHRVDVLGEVLPDAGHLAHLRLAAELAFGADLARDARHLGGEHAELLDHGVDDIGRPQELALQRPAIDLEAHGLQQVALRHGRDGPRHFGRRPQQIVDQRVDRGLHLAPGAAATARTSRAGASCLRVPTTWPTRSSCCAMRSLAATISLKVSAILPRRPDLAAGHAHGEIAHPHGLQCSKQFVQLGRGAAVEMTVRHVSGHRLRGGAVVLEVTNGLAARLHHFLRKNESGISARAQMKPSHARAALSWSRHESAAMFGVLG